MPSSSPSSSTTTTTTTTTQRKTHTAKIDATTTVGEVEEKHTQRASTYANYVLVILLLTYVSNQWNRYLLNYLYATSSTGNNADFVSIEYSTNLSTSQYSLLVGYGFATMYVTMGLFMGRASDIYNRRNIIFIGLLIWNLATMLMGMSNTFWQLLCCRIILGIGESFSAPASYSLIADYFPVEQRAEANGIYAFGVYVGGGLSSLSIVMAQGIGWRASCYLVAGIGGIIAVLLGTTVREPSRTLTVKKVEKIDDEEAPAIMDTLKQIFSVRIVQQIFIASAFRYMAGYAIASYLAVYYEYSFASYDSMYSYLNASVVSIGGALSSYIGGRAADQWEASGQHKARLYVPAIGSALGIPCFAICVLSGNFYVSMLGLFFEYLTAECWFGPVISVLQNCLPSTTRGVAIAAFTFINTFFGALAAYLLGLLIDFITNNNTENVEESYRYMLLISVGLFYGIAAYLFYNMAGMYDPEGITVSKNHQEKQSLLSKEKEHVNSRSDTIVSPKGVNEGENAMGTKDGIEV